MVLVAAVFALPVFSELGNDNDFDDPSAEAVVARDAVVAATGTLRGAAARGAGAAGRGGRLRGRRSERIRARRAGDAASRRGGGGRLRAGR